MLPGLRVPIEEQSQIGEARRQLCRIASSHGLSEEDSSRAALVVTELSTNLLKHSGKGELLLHARLGEIEILALDNGPGMSDLSKCLGDGYSSAGTPGNGLGVIRRQSDRFDVYTEEGKGTVVFAAIAGDRASRTSGASGVIHLAYPGETECGDGWAMDVSGSSASVMVADGLGHGPLAANASKDAVSVFDASPHQEPARFMELAHDKLRGGRGAALSCASIDLENRTLRYSGIGNISGHLLEMDSSRGLLSHNGTVGVQAIKISQTDYSWPNETLLVMHSDGISARWSLSAYPGLFFKSPAIIGGVLYRDFYRQRDDVTILSARLSKLRVAA